MDSRFTRLSLRRAALAVADLVMPRVCVVCGRKLLLSESHVCTECEADLPRTFFASQRDNPMALAFNAMVERELGGSQSHLAFQPYSYAAALLFYRGDSPYKNIPMRLKYGRDFGEGRRFAKMLGAELAASELFADVDLIVPVPLHWARRWRRGYNQAEVIAKGIAEGFEDVSGRKPEVRTEILRRERRTRTQTRLHSSERYANVKSAFVADCRVLESSGIIARIKGGSGKPLHLLLVDDVYTTGATLCASERALREALAEKFGAEEGCRVRISVATLSYVGK